MGSKRGFSSMDPLKQREIASKGGKAAHERGTAHEFTSDEARIAGKKGGAASREQRGTPDGDDNGSATVDESTVTESETAAE